MSGSERPDSNRLIPVKALLQQTKAPHLSSWSALWNEIIRVFVFYSRMVLVLNSLTPRAADGLG